MGCFVVAEFLLTSAFRGPSAIAEPLVSYISELYKSKLINIDDNWYNCCCCYQHCYQYQHYCKATLDTRLCRLNMQLRMSSTVTGAGVCSELNLAGMSAVILVMSVTDHTEIYNMHHRAHCVNTWRHHKSESTQYVATLPAEDLSTGIRNMYRKFGKVWPHGLWDMQRKRDKQTDKETHSSQYCAAVAGRGCSK